MTQKTVKSQTELDQALADQIDRIIIDSPEGVWLNLDDTGEAEVEVRGKSCIDEVWGSATIQSVWDSATIQRVGGSATIQSVWGSATIQSVWDSATIQSVWGSATIQSVWDSATIQSVWDSATIQSVWGSATIQSVWGSATIQSVGGSATIQRVGGSATIQSVWGSATIQRVGGSATIQSAGGSATIRLYGRAKAPKVGPNVAVFLYSADATFAGGRLIDLTGLELTDPVVWCDHQGVEVADGVVTVYKAVDQGLKAGHSYRITDYPIGGTVTAPDWRATDQCGFGLHFSPTPAHTLKYYSGPGEPRFLECQVELFGLVTLDDKVKGESCQVIREVTIGGEPVSA